MNAMNRTQECNPEVVESLDVGSHMSIILMKATKDLEAVAPTGEEYRQR